MGVSEREQIRLEWAIRGRDQGEYFSVLTQLNPAQARLFNLKEGRLSDDVWSSYPSDARLDEASEKMHSFITKDFWASHS